MICWTILWTNLLNSPCCGTSLSSFTSGSFIVVSRPSAFTREGYQASSPKGWLFGRSCVGFISGSQKFHSSSLSGKVVYLPPLVLWTESLFMRNHCSANSQVLLYLCGELKLSIPAVKGYHAALNHVFLLAGVSLAAKRVISRMFRSFKRSCQPCEIKPPAWNLSFVLQSLTHLLYEPFKLYSDKHFTWKTCFLLVLTSTKRVSELHGLSFWVCHLGLEVLYLLFPSGLCLQDPKSVIF